ncbi:MAG: peptidylprolyl isomerase, partial [Planctomycetota bacterium]
TVTSRLADIAVSKGAANQSFDLTNNFGDPNAANARVTFQTNQGSIGIELLNQQAPLTVKNFLSYVDSNKYDNTIVHRSPPSFVVQAGGYTAVGTAPNTSLNHILEDAPVPNEFDSKRSNVRGTLAMAKSPNDPNSAKSEFFFNVADNSSNLNNQNGGFTVFANVVTGMDNVDKINKLATANLGQAFSDIPVINNFTGTTVGELNPATNLVTINDVVVDSRGEMLTFSIVNNSNPNVVTPTVVGNKLNLAYSATNTGSSVIQVRATDLSGRSVDTAFTVRVN